MSTIFMDGFDHYGSGQASQATMLAGPYAFLGNLTCGTPPWGPARTGNFCGVMPDDGGMARRVIPTPGTHFFMSLGLAMDILPLAPQTNNIIDFLDGNGATLFSIGVTPTGALALYNNNSHTKVAQTAGPVFVTQNWHFIELEVNTATHQIQVRVDDTQAALAPIFNVTDASTITGTIAAFGILSNGTFGNLGGNFYIDDWFVRDANGTTNNGWLGDRRVATLFPTSDTPTSGWTPSYYKEFGTGILKLANLIANNNTPQSPNAFISTVGSTTLDVGAGDFTLETFVRFEQLPGSNNYATIFNRWDANANQRSYRLILGGSAFNGGCLQFDTSTDGSAATVVTKIQYPYTPSLNVWHHIALVRAAGQLLLFVDGVQLGVPVNDASTYFGGGTEVFAVGSEVQFPGVNPQAIPNTYLVGTLDETRFTNGFARYTANFTVPSAAFPRGVANDPNWSQVVLLMGYDSSISDESSFLRAIKAFNGAAQYSPIDGPALGKYSTVNEPTPDDNNFISAALTNATNVLTLTTQPANGTTVTVGTKDGSAAAVYTFKTAITTAFDVLIDTTAQNTLANLMNAINAGAGVGTKYGTGTVSNFDVFATALPAGQIRVTANLAGTSGNSIASTSTSTASWATPTLTGGLGIPGPTNFKIQRPPLNTTLISAMQLNVRALKSDSGTATIQNGFVGPLGTLATGPTHPMTVSASYYSDVLERDPDTNGSISPTTIINGQFQINRTA